MKPRDAWIVAVCLSACAPESLDPRGERDGGGTDWIPLPTEPGRDRDAAPVPIPIPDASLPSRGADAAAQPSPRADAGVSDPSRIDAAMEPPRGADAGSPALDGGGAAPPATDASAPSLSLCARACQRVYRECSLGFRSSSGTAISEAQCVSACESGQFRGAESCLATAACSAASLNACFGAAPAPPPSDAGGAVPSDASAGASPATTLEDEVLALTNARRAAGATCGGTTFAPAPPLRGHETLRAVARAHSADMGTRGYFSHNSPDGRTPFQRMMAAGYNASPMGENIAAGNGTAAATVTQWMNSPGHCQNIMNPAYRALGVGYANVPGSPYRHYWTQNFGGM
jgi:uncharacterized protein YkwD